MSSSAICANYRRDDYRSAVGGYYGSREPAAEREAEEEEVGDRS